MVAQGKMVVQLNFIGRAVKFIGRAGVYNSRVILYIGRAGVIFVVIYKNLSNYSKFTSMGRIFVSLEYDGE